MQKLQLLLQQHGSLKHIQVHIAKGRGRESMENISTKTASGARLGRVGKVSFLIKRTRLCENNKINRGEKQEKK